MTGRGTRVYFAAAGITPALRQRLKGAIGAGRANPYIVITPLLVFTAILAVGVWGVLRGADLDAAAARTAAQSRLDGLALNLELSFSRAALPVRQLLDLIQHFPHYATIMSMWGDWLPNWWAAAPGAQSVCMVMAPQGIITAAYPDTPLTRTLPGIDILDGVYRSQTLSTLRSKRYKVSGPYRLPGIDQLHTTVAAPVYFANVSDAETWGIPPSISGCPSGLCYDNATRTKWWGNVAITLDMDSLVRDSSNRSILEQLADIELQYRLIGPNLGDTTLIAIYESTDAAMTSSSLCTKVAVLADQWELCVWVKDWRPAYLVPLLVVLVLVAFLLSTALAAVLLSRHEHKALLRSLLPEEAIQKMQANFDWAASANHGNKPQAMLESGTPAEMILGIMEDIVVGRPPALPKVMAVRHTLQQSLDVYKPLQADLSTRIAQTDNIDSEVHEALMVQLMGRKAKVEPDGDTQAFSEEGDATARPIKLHGNIRTSSGRHSRTAVHRAPLAPALARGHVDGASSPTASPNAPGRLGAPAYRTCVSAPQADLRAAVLLSEPGSGPADQHPDGATREGKEQQQEEEEEEGEGCHVPVPSCALKMQGAAPDLQLTPDLSPPASPGPCSTPGASGPGAGHAVGQLSSMLMRIMAQQQQEVQPPGSGLALLVAQVGQVSALLEAGQQSRRGRAAALHPEAGPLTPHPVPLPCTATLPATSSGGPGSSALGHEEAVLQTAHSQVVLALPSMPHSRQQPWGGGMDTMRSSIELPVQLPAMVQVESCLGSASTWAFDAFHLTSATAGRPLSVLAYWLLQQSGLAAWAHLDHTKLARWLCRVEDGYCANPYHNRSHAADVVQTMHMLLTRGGLMPGYADHLTQLAAYLAAVCHDYQHIGRTNDWLVETQDELALRYNDRSPMENHHLAGAFSLLKHPDLNFLQTMPKATYDRLRKLVIELVLGTDMKQHFSIMGSFTAMHRAAPAMLQSKRSAQALDRASHAVTPSELSMASSCRPTGDGHCAKDAGKKLQPCSEQDKLLSLQMALKCSDLGHLAAPLPVHLAWVSRLEAEFFTQGDAERAHGLPISPLCDRTKQGITKSQVGFFDFVALPLFNNFTTRFTAAKPLLSGVMANYRHWQLQAAAAVEAQAAAEGASVCTVGGGTRP